MLGALILLVCLNVPRPLGLERCRGLAVGRKRKIPDLPQDGLSPVELEVEEDCRRQEQTGK